MSRRLRLASGLFMLAYVTTHLLNHAVGLVSLAAMAQGLRFFTAFWSLPPMQVLLYGSFAVHYFLALSALWQRRTLAAASGGMGAAGARFFDPAAAGAPCRRHPHRLRLVRHRYRKLPVSALGLLCCRARRRAAAAARAVHRVGPRDGRAAFLAARAALVPAVARVRARHRGAGAAAGVARDRPGRTRGRCRRADSGLVRRRLDRGNAAGRGQPRQCSTVSATV